MADILRSKKAALDRAPRWCLRNKDSALVLTLAIRLHRRNLLSLVRCKLMHVWWRALDQVFQRRVIQRCKSFNILEIMSWCFVWAWLASGDLASRSQSFRRSCTCTIGWTEARGRSWGRARVLVRWKRLVRVTIIVASRSEFLIVKFYRRNGTERACSTPSCSFSMQIASCRALLLKSR